MGELKRDLILIIMMEKMSKTKIVQMLKDHKPDLEKYDVKKLGLFGSFLHGEEKRGSDIDLLVSFNKPKGLIDYMRLKFMLEKLLKKKIDLVMEKALKPGMKYVKKEAVYAIG